MDSSDSLDSQNLLIPQLLNNEVKNSEQLFDEIFNNDDDALELNVQKPTKTYQRKTKFKTVRFMEDNSDDDDDDNEDCYEEYDDDEQDQHKDNNFVPLFREEKKKPSRKPRKNRKLTYPNVSKDALLDAWNKAVESKLIPDFDEIDKFPLSIVTEKSPSQIRKTKSKKSQKSPPLTTTITAVQSHRRKSNRSSKKILQPSLSININNSHKNVNTKKAHSTPKLVVDQENTIKSIGETMSKSKKSSKTSKQKVISKKHNENDQENHSPNKDLFDLDVSCIGPTKNENQNKMIQSSTPFASRPVNQSTNQNNRPRRTLRSNRANLF